MYLVWLLSTADNKLQYKIMITACIIFFPWERTLLGLKHSIHENANFPMKYSI